MTYSVLLHIIVHLFSRANIDNKFALLSKWLQETGRSSTVRQKYGDKIEMTLHTRTFWEDRRGKLVIGYA